MAEISVRLVEDEGDLEAARALCREWLDWHWAHYPADWPVEGNPMERGRFEAILGDLPALHARPRGGILLARLDGRPVGCVMYAEAAPGVAEFNRMFVSEGARGHGLGRRMLDAMFARMRSDGYDRVVFSSAAFLTHAREMYRAAGFRDAPPPEGFPEDWRGRVYFMERALGRGDAGAPA